MRSTSSLSRTLRSTSSPLTPTRSAAASSGPGTGATRSTSAPASSRLSRPCQPSATKDAGIDAQAGGSSPATGPRRRASESCQPGGRVAGSIRSATERQRWRRPPGSSMFSNTGPLASGARATSTPAAISTPSSRASAAAASTPISARTRRPRRARLNEAYVAAPPRRQPRGSSPVRSREAAPTTSTSGGPSRPSGRSLTIGPNGDRVYSAGPFPEHPEPCFVFLRTARRRR